METESEDWAEIGLIIKIHWTIFWNMTNNTQSECSHINIIVE